MRKILHHILYEQRKAARLSAITNNLLAESNGLKAEEERAAKLRSYRDMKREEARNFLKTQHVIKYSEACDEFYCHKCNLRLKTLVEFEKFKWCGQI